MFIWKYCFFFDVLIKIHVKLQSNDFKKSQLSKLNSATCVLPKYKNMRHSNSY